MGKRQLGALVTALALTAAGCGGSPDEGSGGSDGASVKGRKGGGVTFLAAADVDYLDPGQSYYTFGYAVIYATQRPLYSFKPDEPEKPVPDLAEGDPKISSDNQTITVKLRSGVRFSPPVNREVTSADVKYAFERAFTQNVPSGYATSYFADIAGAPESPGRFKDIEGIKTPDDRTIVFELDKPTAVTVAAALVMPISVPVPKEYAEKFDKRNPSEYDQYTVFTGPTWFATTPTQDIGRDPGKSIEIVRNPSWDPATDYGRLPRRDQDRGGQRRPDGGEPPHLQGDGLMCCDSGQPPIAILRRAMTSNEDQLGARPAAGRAGSRST
jgi:peptide/nickel transport system substrate-binding protein